MIVTNNLFSYFSKLWALVQATGGFNGSQYWITLYFKGPICLNNVYLYECLWYGFWYFVNIIFQHVIFNDFVNDMPQVSKDKLNGDTYSIIFFNKWISNQLFFVVRLKVGLHVPSNLK